MHVTDCSRPHVRSVALASLMILMAVVTGPAWCAQTGSAVDLAVQPSGASVLARLLEHAQSAFSSSQAIVVRARSADDSHAVLTRYEKRGDGWRRVGNPVPAVLGESGITLDKKEGDGKSPAGTFLLGRAFGTEQAPLGIHMPYTRTTQYDFWVDDPTSADYNRWVTTFQDPHQYWRSFEKLAIPAYGYAVVIDYNVEPIVPGRGSAIFLHIWPGPDGHTVGCTAIAKQQLIVLLDWLDPTQRPVIIQGTAAQLERLATAAR